MKVNLQAVNFNVDKKLVDFVQEKIDKLEKYYDKIVSADVFLKLENTSDKENKIVEIKINVPGDDFVVKKITKTSYDLQMPSAEDLKDVYYIRAIVKNRMYCNEWQAKQMI
jgi:putative sigma-54 modulation protein